MALFDALTLYNQRDTARFHMPGHKGILPQPLSSIAPFDVTELPDTDNLYCPTGAIAQMELAYSKLYGTCETLVSVGGSTLCIQTMLATAVPVKGKIIAARFVHSAAINAMALLDISPVWVFPECDSATGLCKAVTADAIECIVKQNPDACAVYITSPDYFGVICDIAAISLVCRKYSLPLLVDNAHGAHLKFLPKSLHPVDLGADICCDSLHKSLPVVTGGALLHIKNPLFAGIAKRKMSLFASTSPSYITMLSVDICLDYIEKKLAQDLILLQYKISQLAQLASKRGFLQPTGTLEPCRLVVGFCGVGYTRESFLLLLLDKQIECEYCSEDFCVFMASGNTSERDYSRLYDFISNIAVKPKRLPQVIPFCIPEACVSIRTATFSDIHTVSLDNCVGKIAGFTIAPCPPGIPLLVCGERIEKSHINSLKKYGILEINVLE